MCIIIIKTVRKSFQWQIITQIPIKVAILTWRRQLVEIKSSRVVDPAGGVAQVVHIVAQQHGRQLLHAVLQHGAHEAQVGLVVPVRRAQLEVRPRGVEGRALREVDGTADAVHVY